MKRSHSPSEESKEPRSKKAKTVAPPAKCHRCSQRTESYVKCNGTITWNGKLSDTTYSKNLCLDCLGVVGGKCTNDKCGKKLKRRKQIAEVDYFKPFCNKKCMVEWLSMINNGSKSKSDDWRSRLERRLDDLRTAVDDVDTEDDGASEVMKKLAQVRAILEDAEAIPPADVYTGSVAVILR